jgi:ribosomal protein S18 acetylase RimI-like enzyme
VPTAAVEVRPARPEEYAEAGRVTLAGYDADGLLRLGDGTRDDGYAALLADAGRRAQEAELLLAVEDAVVLGSVTWCPPGSPWRQLATEPAQGEFRMLSVAPEGRARGAGRALVTACLSRAARAGLSEVVISSLPQMEPAHRLYRRFGFTRAPELDIAPAPQITLWGYRLQLDGPELSPPAPRTRAHGRVG